MQITEQKAHSLLKNAIAAWSRADVEAMLDEFVDDLTYTCPHGARDGGELVLKGKEDVRLYLQPFADAVESVSVIDKFRLLSNQVGASCGEAYFKHRTTRCTVGGSHHHVITYRDGKIATFTELRGRRQMEIIRLMLWGDIDDPRIARQNRFERKVTRLSLAKLRKPRWCPQPAHVQVETPFDAIDFPKAPRAMLRHHDEFARRVIANAVAWVANEWTERERIRQEAVAAGWTAKRLSAYEDAILTTDNLARQIDNISLSKLRRALRTVGAPAPGDIIRAARLRYAELLLQDSKHLVRDIARRAGYSNEKHFGLKFGLAFGCSPSEYRRRLTGPRAGRPD